jgi:hydrogenase maturation protease
MSHRTVLVAGIGNIFLGDDGFGVEVVRRLTGAALGDGVTVRDFGIRGFDLAYALLDEPDATILVDATPRGGVPGTVYVIEPDLEAEPPATIDREHGAFEGHAMTPESVFALVRALGGRPRNVTVVGCEPLTLGPGNEGRMGLSATVTASVPVAVAAIERLIAGVVHAGSPV